MDDGTESPRSSNVAERRKEVENEYSSENQTTMAEVRIRNKGKNKFTFQEEPTGSSALNTNGSPRKDSMQKEDSSCACFKSRSNGTFKVSKPFMSNNVKHAASASSTSPAVNLRMVRAESLPSMKPPSFMRHISYRVKSESSQECPRRSRPRKASCACHRHSDKPPKKIGEVDDDQEDLLKAALSVHRAREKACSDSFWKEMESYFAPVPPENLLLLKSVLHSTEELSHNQSHVVADESQTLDVLEHSPCIGGEEISVECVGTGKVSNAVPSLFQRALSALTVEEEGEHLYNPNEESSVPLQSDDGLFYSSKGYFGVNDQNDGGSSEISMPPMTYFKCQFQMPPEDDRLLQELHNIGLYSETVPNSEGNEEWITQELKELEEERRQQAVKVKKHLEKIDKAIQSGQDLEKRNTVEFAVDQLTTMAYQKTMGGRRRRYHVPAGPKLPRKEALVLIERTLARCKEFEETGRTCFTQPSLQELLFSAPRPGKDVEPIQINGLTIGSSTRSGIHSKVASRDLGSIGGLSTWCEKLQSGSSGSQQALADSLKGKKKIMTRQNRHKEKAVTRIGQPKRKLVARNSTCVTAGNLRLDYSSEADNISQKHPKKSLSFAQPAAGKPDDDAMDKLRKAEKFSFPVGSAYAAQLKFI